MPLTLEWLICLVLWGFLPVHTSLWRITFVLVCLFVFSQFGVDWDLASNCILSQDIQIRLSVFLIKIWDVLVTGFDGIDRGFLRIFFFSFYPFQSVFF